MKLIYKVKGAYSKASCKKLIKWFENNKHLSKPGAGGENTVLNNLEIPIQIKTNMCFFNLGKILTTSIEKFKKVYPEIDLYLEKWSVDSIAQVMKYKPNQYYNLIHCENGGLPKDIKRVFAWMIFLNTIKKGGGTKFVYQKFTAKPITGDFYIWPAGWSHFHTGVKAPKETKYILTGWCSYII
tara:strand:- start:524 stop:1072 length:549 start_codon:yes stop_codon:yes gene_type:complete